MDTLTWLFLESRLALGALLGTMLFILLVHWRRGGKARPLHLGLVVALVLLVVQTVVMTRREHALRALQQLETAVEDAQVAAVAPLLAAGFTAGEADYDKLDRTAFLELVRDRMREIDIHWVRRTEFEMTASAADRFVVHTTYLAEYSARNFGGPIRSKWAFTFVRVPDGWRIGHIRALEIGGLAHPTFNQIGGF